MSDVLVNEVITPQATEPSSANYVSPPRQHCRPAYTFADAMRTHREDSPIIRGTVRRRHNFTAHRGAPILTLLGRAGEAISIEANPKHPTPTHAGELATGKVNQWMQTMPKLTLPPSFGRNCIEEPSMCAKGWSILSVVSSSSSECSGRAPSPVVKGRFRLCD